MERMESSDPAIEDLRVKMEEIIRDAHSENEVKQLVRKAMPEGADIHGPLALYDEDTQDGRIIRRIQAMILYRDAKGEDHQIEARYRGE